MASFSIHELPPLGAMLLVDGLAKYGLSFDSLNTLQEYGLVISDLHSYMELLPAIATNNKVTMGFTHAGALHALVPKKSVVNVRPPHLLPCPTVCSDAHQFSAGHSDGQARQGGRFRTRGMGMVAGLWAGRFSMWRGSTIGACTRRAGARATGRLGVCLPQPSRYAPEGAGGGCPRGVVGAATVASGALRTAVDEGVVVVAQSRTVSLAVCGRGLAAFVM